ncbi:MAG TPA: lysylphosphatidylglycerol synthase domain-containing protein [Chloroflexota bacterium]|nr:lysylphosphatidylglycerol synthase domain-containing protein [Chloroflexota bacterium]
MLKTLTRPRVLIPILLSAALLAFLLSISDVPDLLDRISRIPVRTMVLVFCLALFYLVLKGVLFRLFLDGLGIYPTSPQLIVSFATGEATLTLPAGIYAQNYVLRRIAAIDFSISSAATTALLATEGGVALVILAILGIPGWDWLRPAILSFFAVAAIVVTALMKLHPARRLGARLAGSGLFALVEREFIEMVEGLASLFTPGMAARAVPLTVTYLLALVTGFYIVAQAIGVTGFGFGQAATVYLFALSIVLLSPISTHLGVIEAGGVGAMMAWGYGATEALALLLGFRLVWTGSVWIACGTTLVALRDELRRGE